MAEVRLDRIAKSFGGDGGDPGDGPDHRGGGVLRPRRPLGLREVHAPAHHRGARGADVGARSASAGADVTSERAAEARHRDGVPVLRALPAHDGGARTWRSGSRWPKVPKAERTAARGGRGADAAARADYLDRKPRAALGRAAAARGDRAGASCGSRRCSCSTSRCRTSTPSCGWRCGSSSRGSTATSARR